MKTNRRCRKGPKPSYSCYKSCNCTLNYVAANLHLILLPFLSSFYRSMHNWRCLFKTSQNKIQNFLLLANISNMHAWQAYNVVLVIIKRFCSVLLSRRMSWNFDIKYERSRKMVESERTFGKFIRRPTQPVILTFDRKITVRKIYAHFVQSQNRANLST